MAVEIAPQKREIRAERRQGREPGQARGRGLSALVQACGWGGAAALAMIALAITIQTDTGRERLRQAYTGTLSVAGIAPEPPKTAEIKTPDTRALEKLAAEKDAITRALEAQLRSLNADRDRLAARMASLERHLEDMTGSIQRQAAQAPTPAAAPPAPANVASAAPAAPLPKPIDPLAMPLAHDAGTGWPASAAAPAERHTALHAAEEPQTAVPLPPARVIGSAPEPTAPVAAPAPQPQFGIELATAPSMDALRSHWSAVKASNGPLLAGLQPIAVREARAGGTDYKLIAGPLPSLNAARQLCARFADAHAACRPARIRAESVVQR